MPQTKDWPEEEIGHRINLGESLEGMDERFVPGLSRTGGKYQV